MRKKLLALALGLVFALSLLEVSIRLVGIRDKKARRVVSVAGEQHDYEKLSRPYRILVLGNSHTQGVGAKPGESYSDFLQARLDETNPGQVGVFNRGVANTNTRHLLEQLENNLLFYKPTAVVVMTGQPNHWNKFGYGDYLKEADSYERLPWPVKLGLKLRHATYQLRLWRFYEVVREEMRAKDDSPKSLVFRNVRLSDSDLLAWSWIDHFNQDLPPARLSEAEADEAIAALTSLREKHPKLAVIHIWLSQLYWQKKFSAKLAAESLENVLAARDGHFEIRTAALLEQMKGALGTRAYSALRAKFAPKRPDAVTLAALDRFYKTNQLPYPADSEKNKKKNFDFLKLAAESNPIHPAAFTSLANKFIAEKNFPEALAWAQKGLAENPMGPTQALFLQLLATPGVREDKAMKEKVLNAFEEQQAKIPNRSWSLRQMQSEHRSLDSWVKFDLNRIATQVKKHSAALVLQTYPPQRLQWRPIWCDPLIEDFAADNGIPLSATAIQLTKYFAYGNFEERGPRKSPDFKDSFYNEENPKDGHLNGRGYKLVSEILYETLRKEKLLPEPVTPLLGQSPLEPARPSPN